MMCPFEKILLKKKLISSIDQNFSYDIYFICTNIEIKMEKENLFTNIRSIITSLNQKLISKDKRVTQSIRKSSDI